MPLPFSPRACGALLLSAFFLQAYGADNAIDPTAASTAVATMAMVRKDYAQATALMKQQLAEADAKAASDLDLSKLIRMRALTMLGRIAYSKGEIEQARTYLQNAFAVYAGDSDPKANLSKIEPLGFLAGEYRMQKDYEHALATAQQALDILGRSPEPAWRRIAPLLTFAHIYVDQGKLDEEKAVLEEAQDLAYHGIDVDKGLSFDLYSLSKDLYSRTGDAARWKEMDWRSVVPVPPGLPMSADQVQCIPNYPRKARMANQQGMTTVEVTVDQDSKFLKAEIIKSSGSVDLDEAVLDSLKRCRNYKAAIKNGKPVTSSYRAAYKWSLDD